MYNKWSHFVTVTIFSSPWKGIYDPKFEKKRHVNSTLDQTLFLILILLASYFVFVIAVSCVIVVVPLCVCVGGGCICDSAARGRPTVQPQMIHKWTWSSAARALTGEVKGALRTACLCATLYRNPRRGLPWVRSCAPVVRSRQLTGRAAGTLSKAHWRTDLCIMLLGISWRWPNMTKTSL
jgi:hypothetical protein